MNCVDSRRGCFFLPQTTVTNQMKLLPTAFFSVVALNRSLQLQQWVSLPVLALGVSIVNLSSSAHSATSALLGNDAASTTDGVPVKSHTSADGAQPGGSSSHGHWFLGLAAALAAAVFSGYASVFVERLLKTERFAANSSSSGPHHHHHHSHTASSPAAAQAAGSPAGKGGPSRAEVALEDVSVNAAAEEGKLLPTAQSSGGPAAASDLASSSSGGVSGSSPASAELGRPLLTLNVQLAGWGALFAGIQVLAFTPHGSFRERGLGAVVDNFNWYTWAVIWLQALGGLVVGLVLKYTDNIVKGFATAVSILLSCVLESAMNSILPSPSFLIGLALVLLSFALFSGPDDLLARVVGPHLAAAVGGGISSGVASMARGWRGGGGGVDRVPTVLVFVFTVLGVGFGGLLLLNAMRDQHLAEVKGKVAAVAAAGVGMTTLDGEVIGIAGGGGGGTTLAHGLARPMTEGIRAYPPPVMSSASALWDTSAQHAGGSAGADHTLRLSTTSEAGLGAGQLVVASQARDVVNASAARGGLAAATADDNGDQAAEASGDDDGSAGVAEDAALKRYEQEESLSRGSNQSAVGHRGNNTASAAAVTPGQDGYSRLVNATALPGGVSAAPRHGLGANASRLDAGDTAQSLHAASDDAQQLQPADGVGAHHVQGELHEPRDGVVRAAATGVLDLVEGVDQDHVLSQGLQARRTGNSSSAPPHGGDRHAGFMTEQDGLL